MIRKGETRKERRFAFLQYVEVAAPVDVVEKSLVCNRVRWFPSDEINDMFCGKEFQHCMRRLGIDMELKFYRVKPSVSMLCDQTQLCLRILPSFHVQLSLQLESILC